MEGNIKEQVGLETRYWLRWRSVAEYILTRPGLHTREHDTALLHSCLGQGAKYTNRHNTIKQ